MATPAHQYEVSGTELHGAKHPQYDAHDVEEVGQDGSPLVPQEIKHLSLHCCHLQARQRTMDRTQYYTGRELGYRGCMQTHTHTHRGPPIYTEGTGTHTSAAVVSMVTAWSMSPVTVQEEPEGHPNPTKPSPKQICGPHPATKQLQPAQRIN